MDSLNVVVIGEPQSGTTTFMNALKLTKTQLVLNISENMSDLPNADVVFCIMNINEQIDHLSQIFNFQQINQCFFIPVFNKLDQCDFTLNEKTCGIVLGEDIDKFVQTKLHKFYEVIDIQNTNNHNDMVICSAEYAYMYLYLSTCTKSTANSNSIIVSKIGQYEHGKLAWNKKSTQEKSAFAISTVDRLKKSARLTEALGAVGYNVQQNLQKYITDEILMELTFKHLTQFHDWFKASTESSTLLETLTVANDKFNCQIPPNILSMMDLDNMMRDFANYIDSYDYTAVDFQIRSQILAFYKNCIEEKTQLFTSNLVLTSATKAIDFLTATLSQEIGLQLGACETFGELVDKLYECLDITEDIYVDQILTNHKTFKALLFSPNLRTNLEYALEKFDLDVKSFFLQIIEMRLQALLTNSIDHKGSVETMMIVSEFLDVKLDLIQAVPSLSKYKILLRYGLSSLVNTCDKALLISMIDDENTLYVENIYYDLICGTKIDASDTSIEEEPEPEPLISPPRKKQPNKTK